MPRLNTSHRPLFSRVPFAPSVSSSRPSTLFAVVSVFAESNPLTRLLSRVSLHARRTNCITCRIPSSRCRVSSHAIAVLRGCDRLEDTCHSPLARIMFHETDHPLIFVLLFVISPCPKTQRFGTRGLNEWDVVKQTERVTGSRIGIPVNGLRPPFGTWFLCLPVVCDHMAWIAHPLVPVVSCNTPPQELHSHQLPTEQISHSQRSGG